MKSSPVQMTVKEIANILNGCQSTKSLTSIQILSLCLKKLGLFIARKLRKLSWIEKFKPTIYISSAIVIIKPTAAGSSFFLKVLKSPLNATLMTIKLLSQSLKFPTTKKTKEKSVEPIDKCATNTIVKTITFSDIAKGELVLK